MKIEQSFTVSRPIDEVWAFFQRIEEVAGCMPGAQLTGEKSPGLYTGRVTLKLGPFGGSFDGEAAVSFDQGAKSGHVEGKGVDKRGGSRSRMTVDFALEPPSPRTTAVRLDADVTLSGAIAQFGRTGIIQETAKILIGDFVANLEQRLSSKPSTPAPEASAPEAPAPQAAATEVPSTGRGSTEIELIEREQNEPAAAQPGTTAGSAKIGGLWLIWRAMIGWVSGLFGHQP